MVEIYTQAVNSDDYPCIESTLDRISHQMCEKAKEEALELYRRVRDIT